MDRDFTVGMACFNDFDGVYFTVEALKVFHADRVAQIIVVDDSPEGPVQERTMKWCRRLSNVLYVRSHVHGTSAPRNRVFAEATSEKVVCIDSHVLIHPGSFSALDDFWAVTAGHGIRLAHGVLMEDDNRVPLSSFRDEWGDDLMHGKWHTDTAQFPLTNLRVPGTAAYASDDLGRPVAAKPWIDVWSQGLGGFACLRDEWPGFHPGFSQFGGEEGYIDDKFRRMGGMAVSVSGFRWTHRFHDQDVKTPASSYSRSTVAKFRNYVLGRRDNLLQTADVTAAYAGKGHPAERWASDVETEVNAKPSKTQGSVTVSAPAPAKKCGGCGAGGSKEVAEKWAEVMSRNAELRAMIESVKSIAAGKHVWVGPEAYAGVLESSACVAAVAAGAASVTLCVPKQDDTTKNWVQSVTSMLSDKVSVSSRDMWPGQAIVLSPVGLPGAVKEYTHEISKVGSSWVVSTRAAEPKRIPLPVTNAAAVAAQYPDHAVVKSATGKPELAPVWELDPSVKVLPGRGRMALNYLKFLTSDKEQATPEVAKERMDKCWTCPNRKPVLYPDRNWYQRCTDTEEAKGCGCFLDWSPPNPNNNTQPEPGKVAYADQACPRGFW